MACRVSVQERFRGWWRRGFSFGCRPYVGFRGAADGRPLGAQQLAWRHLVAPSPHSVGDGDAVPGMVL
jgi:hypothetical protein